MTAVSTMLIRVILFNPSRILQRSSNYPSVPEAYYNRAIAYTKVGNLNEALVDFTKVIELNPTNPAGYHNRAVCFYQLKEYNKAWEGVRKAEELGAKVIPSYPDA